MNLYKILIAFIGGYIISAQLSITLALILPFEIIAESVMFSNLISFTIWAFLFLYCFKNISIKKLLTQFICFCLILFIFNHYLLGGIK